MKNYALNEGQTDFIKKSLNHLMTFASESSQQTIEGILMSLANPIDIKPQSETLTFAGIDQIFFASGTDVKGSVKLQNDKPGFLK